MSKALLLFIMLLLGTATLVLAAPSGPSIITNTTYNISLAPALMLNTSGGSFTEMVINATTQNFRWKAYVGNVSGSLTLADSSNYSVYSWNLTTTGGEIFASRNNSVNWASIACTSNATITTEQAALNITSGRVDSINTTFSSRVHRGFYVGDVSIGNSTCRSTATYVNSAAQASSEGALFQEVLLSDSSNLVYASPLENRVVGYNTRRYDFQFIVPDYGLEAVTANVPYYFYVELS